MICGVVVLLCIIFKVFIVSLSDEFIIIVFFFLEYSVFIKSVGVKDVIILVDIDNF